VDSLSILCIILLFQDDGFSSRNITGFNANKVDTFFEATQINGCTNAFKSAGRISISAGNGFKSASGFTRLFKQEKRHHGSVMTL